MTGVTLERGDGVTRTFAPVRVRIEARATTRTPYRGPYGQTWRAAGRQQMNAPIIRLTFDAIDDERGITAAANQGAHEFAAAVQEAALITTVAGAFIPAAILDISRTPIASGQAITVRLATRRERQQDDSRVLRFSNGRIWELR